jgi:TP901 family phage tail tape measure protein
MASKSGKASIVITGDTAQAIAALEALGIKAEETSGKVDAAFGDRLAGSLDRTGNIFSKLGNSITGLGLPFGETFSKMGDKIESADTKGQKFLSTISAVGKVSAVAAAVGLAVVATESVKMGENFQKATTSLAANAGISSKAAANIGYTFLDTAGKTIYSGLQITQAYSNVAAQLGTVQGHALDSKQAMTVMSAAMDLAEGSGTDLTSATQSLAAVMQVYHKNAGDAASVSDVLFNTSRLTDTSLSSVAQTVDRLHGRLGAATPSLSQISGLMLDLAEKGVTGRQAMSGLSTAMTGLLAPSTAQKNILEEMGVTVFNAQGQFVGMGSVIQQLQPKFAGMTAQQQDLTAKTLFGAQAYQGMLQVIQGGVGGFNAATAAVDKTGSAHAAAAVQAKTLQHQMETMKSTMEDLGTKLGLVLIPALQSFGKILASVIGWMDSHQGVVKALVITLGTLAAALIAVGVAGFIAENVLTLGVGVAVAGLIIGAVELVEHWNAVIKFLRSDMGTLVVLILGPLAPLALLALHWQQVWQGIQVVTGQVVSTIINQVKNMGNVFFTMIEGILGAASHLPFVGHYFAEANDAIKGYQAEFDASLSGIANGFASWGATAGNQFASGVGAGLTKALQNTQNVNAAVAAGEEGAMHKVAGYAEGGIITKPTLAMVGEAGYPEIIIPLKKGMGQLNDSSKPLPSGIAAAINGQSGKSGSSMQNTFVFNTQADPNQIASEITWELGRLVS